MVLEYECEAEGTLLFTSMVSISQLEPNLACDQLEATL